MSRGGSPAFACTSVFLLAFALRAGYVGYRWLWNDGLTSDPLVYDDERLHLALGVNLAQNGEMAAAGRYASRMPLYPAYLSLFAGLGLWGILAARLGQATLGALTAAVAARFAGQALGPRSAWLAGLLAALDPFAIFFTNLLLTETLFALIAVSLAFVTWRLAAASNPGTGPADRSGDGPADSMGEASRPDAGSRVRRRLEYGLGVLCVAAVMTRPEALGWVLLAWLIILATVRPRRRALSAVTISAAFIVLALGLWGFRNKQATGEWVWLSTNGGVTLYDGLGPQADGSSDQSFLATMPDLLTMSEVQRDRALRDRAMRHVRADPARVASLAWTKFLRTWSFTPNVAEYRGGAAARVSMAWMVLVVAAAAVGTTRLALAQSRRLHVLLGVLLGAVVYFTLVTCIFVGSVRYRVPLMPFVEIVAAAGLMPGLFVAGRRPNPGVQE